MSKFLNNNADFFLGAETGLAIVVVFFSFLYIFNTLLTGFFVLMPLMIVWCKKKRR